MLLRMPLIPVGPLGGMAEPMYRVIADDLAQQIESGKLRVGAQVKTEVELREEYGRPDAPISRTTVRDAIKLLVARGLVETRPGHGTFVRGRTEPFVSRLTADPTAGGLEDEIYRSEVERQGRAARRDPAARGGSASPGGDRSVAAAQGRHGRTGYQPTPTAIHRRHPVLDADHLLPDEVRHGQFGRAALGSSGHRRRSGRLSPRPRHQSGGLARPVLRAATGARTNGPSSICPTACRWLCSTCGGPDTTRRAIPSG